MHQGDTSDAPDWIDRVVAAGTAAWPNVRVDVASFAREVRAAEREAPPKEEHASDFYLAMACALGAEGAIEAFDASCGGFVRRAVARVCAEPAFVDEVVQDIRVRLLAEAPPKIRTYLGHAKLSTWLTTIAVREALAWRRRAGAVPFESAASRVERAAGPKLDPELAYVRRRYKREFERAFATGLARLAPKERAILRLHLAERMTVDRLAALYNVGRSTAGRWLMGARESLFKETHDELRRNLRLTPSELRSVAALLRSEFDVSIVRLLGADASASTRSAGRSRPEP